MKHNTPKLSPKALNLIASGIKLVLMDIDGVLADGLLYHFVDSSGKLVEFKGVNSQDSISLIWLSEFGVKTGFISGRNSAGMEERLKILKASFIYQGRLDKKAVFEDIGRQSGIPPAQTAYIGDDFPDIPVIKSAGLGIAVKNARPEVKSAAAWVTTAAAGDGAVRQVAELILKSQGRWTELMGRFN
jgi:3-deoxy-D-manno-octulosonate 8-phosphate phosphatase (KDO 8-P phosphatase)